MISSAEFIEPAKSFGFNTWAGVPCSFLTPFINSVIDDPDMSYTGAANEGDAVAIATGAALAGRRAVALMQNSGLGNAVSPLSSLNWVFRIPVLLIITLRGEPGLPDEPQHELMGQITGRLLEELQIPWAYFPKSAEDVEGALTVAAWQMEKSGLPYAFIMQKGAVEPASLRSQWIAPERPRIGTLQSRDHDSIPPTRRQALEALVSRTPVNETVVIATTGYTGRELYAVDDRENQIYMVGSMGCASSLGLGLSFALPEHRIVVVDGDGAALMRMGNLATIGAYAGKNFQHVVLDNAVHESTGGQPTVSEAISFSGIASACGYVSSQEAASVEELEKFLETGTGPGMLQLKISTGVPDGLPRPDQSPAAIKQRLMGHLGITSPWAGL
jgi:phosphonopyruvate decarboxylase